MKKTILALSLLFATAPAFADDAPIDVAVAQADTGSSSATANAPAATPAPDAAKAPDPAEQPAEAASLLYRLYKAGHLIPAIILFSFFLLTLLQRWIAWLRTGYRKLVVTSALGALAMLAERAADGTTPNLTMLMGAIGVALALWTNGKGAAKTPATEEA